MTWPSDSLVEQRERAARLLLTISTNDIGLLAEQVRRGMKDDHPFVKALAQAIEARQGGDAKQAPSQDESAVGTMRPDSTQGIQP